LGLFVKQICNVLKNSAWNFLIWARTSLFPRLTLYFYLSIFKQQGINEYQNINHKQSVKVKKLKEKIEYLKNFIEKEVKNYDQQIEKVKNDHQNKILELEKELKSNLYSKLIIRLFHCPYTHLYL